MRRQKSIITTLTVAIGLALAVPLCATAAPSEQQNPYSALADLAVSANLLDAWRDYALETLKPGFSWANEDHETARAPSLFDRGRGRVTSPASHFSGSVIEPSPIHVALLTTRVTDTPLYVPANATNIVPDHAPGWQRQIISPSITQRIGDSGLVSVSAILAYQRFTDIGMGWLGVPSNNFDQATSMQLRYAGTSSGAGMRVDYSNALSDRLSWQVGYQTRVNMDAFNSYRGVYAEPGSFDIPASSNVGFGLALTPQLRIDAGVERVMYGQVTPFTSSALPARFLALLSSSASPVFAWQDLNVYSVGGSWQDKDIGDWSFRYSTREQPLPTSTLLQQALPNLSSHNAELAYTHAFGVKSSLRLAASYAPTDFMLGAPLSYSLGHGSNEMEWGALWTTVF